MTPRILTAVDPDHPEPQVVEVAARLARALGAELTLVAVNPRPGGDPVFAADAELAVEAAYAALEGVTAAAGTTPVDLQVVSAPSPARALQKFAARHGAVLIAAGAGRHHRLGRLGSVASRLLHGTPCPVLIVPTRLFALRRDLRRMGVGFVPTVDGREALETAAGLAATLAATLEVFAVAPPAAFVAAPAPPVILGTPRGDELRQARRDDIERATRRAVAELAPGATVRVEEGDPATVLADETRSLDLLVCGSRGQGAITGAVLGTVSRRLVHEAACPVLVVPRGRGLALPAGPRPRSAAAGIH